MPPPVMATTMPSTLKSLWECVVAMVRLGPGLLQSKDVWRDWARDSNRCGSSNGTETSSCRRDAIGIRTIRICNHVWTLDGFKTPCRVVLLTARGGMMCCQREKGSQTASSKCGMNSGCEKVCSKSRVLRPIYVRMSCRPASPQPCGIAPSRY